MVHNITVDDLPGDGTPSSSLLQLLAVLLRENPSITAATAISLPIVLLCLNRLFFPTFDSREPPVLRPWVPFVGHIVSMAREKCNWYSRLFNDHGLPICTLPMLNGKMYLINSPHLIAAALKHPYISFDPFFIEYASVLFDMKPQHVKEFVSAGIDTQLIRIIHSGLSGESLRRLTVSSLSSLMDAFNAITPDTPLVVTKGYPWLRRRLVTSSFNALFGSHNPIREETTDLVADFETGISALTIGVAPNILAPRALAARVKLNRLLEKYYEEEHHIRGSEVSDVIRERAQLLTSYGYNAKDLGNTELPLAWGAVTNTALVFFWLFIEVFTRPEYLERIRAEISALTSVAPDDNNQDGRVATIQVAHLESRCPVFMGVYREVLRYYVHIVGNRRVMRDAVLRDADGREYLLKKGINIQWSSSVTHEQKAIWGEGAEEFDPERFINVPPQEEKARRPAFLTFGGGRNLCPGRSLAQGENMGLVGCLALGFDVQGVTRPESEAPDISLGVRRPVGEIGTGFTMVRRKGWEKVRWVFA